MPSIDAGLVQRLVLTEFAGALAPFLLALRRVDATDGPAPDKHNLWRGWL